MANTTACEHCGDLFEFVEGPGRPPLYCSRAHRQRAYEGRRSFYDRETLIAMAEMLGMECYMCGKKGAQLMFVPVT